MPETSKDDFIRYSVSLVRQGKHQFYTLTMPSDVLANSCFATNRYADPKEGFQRMLDVERARQIADYIDTGFGTVPTSIVLSAQPAAELRIIGKGKTLEFRNTRKAFLILDGQHRVYGFSLAKTHLRVPVVIYNGLSRKDESKLFIDINTKQRPVPNELLLDIKSLAEYESDTEQLLRDIFDRFMTEPQSPLVGLLSPAEKVKGKISRVTFNAAFKPIIAIFAENEGGEIYDAVCAFLNVFITNSNNIKAQGAITNPIVFRAVMLFFKDVAQRVQDKWDKSYTVENFSKILDPVFRKVKPSSLKRPGTSSKVVYEQLVDVLRSGFKL